MATASRTRGRTPRDDAGPSHRGRGATGTFLTGGTTHQCVGLALAQIGVALDVKVPERRSPAGAALDQPAQGELVAKLVVVVVGVVGILSLEFVVRAAEVAADRRLLDLLLLGDDSRVTVNGAAHAWVIVRVSWSEMQCSRSTNDGSVRRPSVRCIFQFAIATKQVMPMADQCRRCRQYTNAP